MIYAALVAVGFTMIVLYATWLFAERLRVKDRPFRSFVEWLKHLLEAVLGL